MKNEFDCTGKGELQLGRSVQIGEGASIVFARPSKVTLGDYCRIGPGVKIVCDGGDVVLGDWTTLHDRCLVLSTAGVQIGQHGWFGQHCVLDGTGGLVIGHGVRVGMYSQIWSHVAAGELIEGCTLHGTRPVNIDDDVWLVGSCIVASGVSLGRRCVALIASNITKSWPAGTVLAGSPAAPKTGLQFYRDVSLDEKWQMLLGWLDGIAQAQGHRLSRPHETIAVIDGSGSDSTQPQSVVFVRADDDLPRARELRPHATWCSIQSKRYFKRVNALEHQVLGALAGHKARFLSSPETAAAQA